MAGGRPRKLDGRVAVVTGASSGVGRAIAQLYAAEGARVALIARDLIGLEDAASEIRSTGGQAMVLPLDVSQSTAVAAAADRVVSAWGKIDVWVNDATVSIFAPADETTPDEYRRVMEVNYLGYVHGTLAALRHMRLRNAGVIVQIGSEIAGRSVPRQSANSASRAAIRGFTEALHGELARARSGIQLTHVQLPVGGAPGEAERGQPASLHRRRLPAIAEPQAIAAVALRAALRPRPELGIRWRAVRAVVQRGRRSKRVAAVVSRMRSLLGHRRDIGVWLSGLAVGAAVYLWARRLWATPR
ncbi:MAG TPA: SDR family oxidoreductase [Polyangia bacterium]